MTTIDPLREHAYDGIQEFDNRLPNWWLWTFYLACIFSVFYWLHYHVLGTGPLPPERYRMEMEAAEARLAARLANQTIDDAVLQKLAAEPTFVEKGRQVFIANCAQCHKEDGGGNIGPNLTDEYWLHGSRPEAIYQTVINGVPAKGMVAWGPVLGPARCQQAAAYVLTLRNTHVAGGKEPQGEAQPPN
ncbi:MAG: cbb3-type cytochrome c oxidase N-terminal domain-containing protein [Planctomycetota bacterium]